MDSAQVIQQAPLLVIYGAIGTGIFIAAKALLGWSDERTDAQIARRLKPFEAALKLICGAAGEAVTEFGQAQAALPKIPENDKALGHMMQGQTILVKALAKVGSTE